MKSKKKLNLYSEKPEVINILEEFKQDTKIYSKLIEALQLLGNFPKQVEAEIYEEISTEKESYIKIYCCDIDGNVFILCPLSSNKQEKLKIEKITNDSTQKYDLSLLKNFTLTKENIEYAKTAKTYDFKFGRLITDEKTFYSLFMSDNLGYQIQIQFDDKGLYAKELISSLNKLNKIPDIMGFSGIFYQLMIDKNISFNEIALSMFKNFDRIKHIEIEGNNQKHKQKIRTK